MFKRTIALFMVLIWGAFVFAGCSLSTSTKGDVYVGKWSGKAEDDPTNRTFNIEITPNGQSYIVKYYFLRDGKQSGLVESGASLTNDGILNVTVAGPITHVKADDTLKPGWLPITLKRVK